MNPRDHRNNFDAMRLFAACLVIYGHQLQMRGLVAPLPLGVPISKTGLDIFFSVSGYLITDSWRRDPRLPAFLAKRALRIFPGLATVVLLSVFVLGPAVTRLPLAAYVRQPDTYLYLTNAALLLQNHLPGVFTQGFEQAVNGSLWSLLPEFLCYCTVPLLALLPRHPRVFALCVLAGLASITGFHLVTTGQRIILLHMDLRFALLEVCFFFAGAALRLLDNDSHHFYRMDTVILLCAARVVLGISHGALAMMLDPALISYLVVAFGRSRTAVLDRASRYGDLSYGLYLYAFPVQQLVNESGLPHKLLVILALTAALAWLSWHIVERPALRLKPGRATAPR